MCRCLTVSRSAYYAWACKQRPTPKDLEDKALLDQVREAHSTSRGIYGSPRIHAALNRRGLIVSRHRVARLMRQHGLRGRVRRRYRCTTDSKHAQPIAPNRLRLAFYADRSDLKWCADITRIPVQGGFLYLAAIIDIPTRLVVGWALADHMEASLVEKALLNALAWRRPAAGAMHHSDHGSQYASGDFQKLLKAHGIECSMRRMGDCWDNAMTESFFGTIKQELIHDSRWKGMQEARPALHDYIERFYNRTRLHSGIGYRTPIEMDRELARTASVVINHL